MHWPSSLAAQETQPSLILHEASAAKIFERPRIPTLKSHDTRGDVGTLQRKRSRVPPHMAHWPLARPSNNQRVLCKSDTQENFSSHFRRAWSRAEGYADVLECPFVPWHKTLILWACLRRAALVRPEPATIHSGDPWSAMVRPEPAKNKKRNSSSRHGPPWGAMVHPGFF